MAHTQAVDELVKEFLVFRGFSATARTFEADVRADKEKGLRVDRLLDQLTASIASHDLTALRDLWSHLDTYIFSKLEIHFTPGT